MQIDITDIEHNELRRLGKLLNAGTVPFPDLLALVENIRQKCDAAAGITTAKRSRIRRERKDNWRNRLKVAS